MARPLSIAIIGAGMGGLAAAAALRRVGIDVTVYEQAAQFARVLTPSARRIIERLWPGPVAIVVERAPDSARAAALGGPTISLRCPDDAARG